MISTKVFILCALPSVGVLGGCSNKLNSKDHHPKVQEQETKPSYPYTVMTKESYGLQGEVWLPNTLEISLADAALRRFLDLKIASLSVEGKLIVNESYVQDHIDTNARQYVGLIDGEKKLILINSFPLHLPRFDGWESRYIYVMDGGADFWRAAYDVESNERVYLRINGRA